MSWADLSDDELQARLERRVPYPNVVAELVRARDKDEAAKVIGEVLDHER